MTVLRGMFEYAFIVFHLDCKIQDANERLALLNTVLGRIGIRLRELIAEYKLDFIGPNAIFTFQTIADQIKTGPATSEDAESNDEQIFLIWQALEGSMSPLRRVQSADQAMASSGASLDEKIRVIQESLDDERAPDPDEGILAIQESLNEQAPDLSLFSRDSSADQAIQEQKA